MKKESIISILNRQIIDSERNDIITTSPGTYLCKDGKYYIIYNDCESSSGKNNLSIIKIKNPNLITINKTGIHRSQLILEKSKRHYCQYKTEFGFLTMGIYTVNIICDLRESSGSIYTKYYMDINSNVTTINEIYINIKENKNYHVNYANNVN